MSRDDEFSDALHRVCADAAFARSPQLRRMLDYLVTSARAGGTPPKEYTIATEALGRSDDFDSDRDAIVRVQAGRLRRALDRYYAGNGRDDPVRIVLPVGSYGIRFEPQAAVTDREDEPDRQEEPDREDRPDVPEIRGEPDVPVRATQSWRRAAVVLGGIAALLAAAFSLPLLHDRPGAALESPARAGLALAPVGNGLPTLVVLPVEVAAAGEELPVLTGLGRRMAAAFARFETVNTIYLPRPVPGEANASPRFTEGERAYELAAFATHGDNSIRIEFRLTDRTTGLIVWTRPCELVLQGDINAQQERIVSGVAAVLLQPSGVVASHERTHQLRSGNSDPRYRCILQAADAMRDAIDKNYADARACLERVIESDPGNALAHSYLVSILTRIHQFGWPPEPGIRKQALVVARDAVIGSPASARAHFALFLARFVMRDFEAADAAMAKARELNDNDLVIRAVYGGRLITSGRIDEGIAILDGLGPAFPARYCAHGFYLYLGYYLKGDRREAHRLGHELTCPSYPLVFVARALDAVQAGDIAQARAELGSLAALVPGWRIDPRAVLARTIPDDAIVERLLHDLADAGVTTAAAN